MAIENRLDAECFLSSADGAVAQARHDEAVAAYDALSADGSVDPSHVPGVLLSNSRLPAGTVANLIDIAPTLLARYGIDPAPPHTEMDGRVLPFAGLKP